ncbi:efflux RND transporter permease subunit, partial [bacterium LRH843]|nr:efflux RND transporter permease subunit [bacterium LRH843]
VNLVGLQDQKIWIEISNTKSAQLGIPVTAVQQALQQQNTMASAGFFETESDRIQLRVTGQIKSVEELQRMPLLVNGKTIQLSDVADVYRGFSEPAQPRMRFMGENGIGIAVSMRKGGDILA